MIRLPYVLVGQGIYIAFFSITKMNWGGVIGILTLVSLVVYGGIALYPSPAEIAESIAGTSPRNAVTIALEASCFADTPEIVRVTSGQNVTMVIANVDTIQGVHIPALNVSGTREVTFIAPAPGTYEFFYPIICDSGHREMKGSLIVE